MPNVFNIMLAQNANKIISLILMLNVKEFLQQFALLIVKNVFTIITAQNVNKIIYLILVNAKN